MDFNLTDKQKELVGLARDIAQKEIAPRALSIDKSGVMDEELLRILKQSGMTALSVSKGFGGGGTGHCRTREQRGTATARRA